MKKLLLSSLLLLSLVLTTSVVGAEEPTKLSGINNKIAFITDPEW
ncbi:hypothetical protein [Brevibacillus laterosporus]|uniref:ABC transporter substrate-binding protein n=1 Tax=Brevibacillus laterosporus TaxID=1465 RepID=A0AAP3GCB1_BRELA|nr:hypothetical protein [Brevibacillus laterosporus]MCR8978733.1 hypothetical protein [Brevibacillus laterosporus]MCZ0805889.1 hypothetical protein [Brevibacillus laterosporus]MCZ0824345.1 hypothetical protein [Brevibacillus laterosporus]MCZ0848249.1 hypothetical protein [Brevibacillus laterosporus]